MKNKEISYQLTFKGLLANALRESEIMTSEELFNGDSGKMNKFYQNLKEYFSRRDNDLEKLVVFIDENSELRMEMVPMQLQNPN